MSHPVSTVSVMSLIIDCATCTRRHTSSCEGCVVSFIVDRQPEEAVVIDVAEFSALRRLQSAGLVPELLHDGREGAVVDLRRGRAG